MPMNMKVVVAHGFLKQRRRNIKRRGVLYEAQFYAGRREAPYVHTCIHLCSPEELVVATKVLTREFVNCNIQIEASERKFWQTGLLAASR